jgi:hypothetical protein
MKKISLRIDDNLEEMLADLEREDALSSESENREPMNRTQIIRQAIRQYYAAHSNGKAQNAFLDMMRIEMETLLDDYFKKQYAVIAGRTNEIDDHLRRYAIKDLLLWKMFLVDNDWNTVTDPERIRQYLDEDTVFETVVDERVQKEMRKNK